MQIFEVIMLICFGISWPVSVIKSYKTKSTKGKSVIFLLAVIIGYISGITGKIVNGDINYVLVLYSINLFVVLIDFSLYLINRHNEKKSSFIPSPAVISK